MSRVHFDLSGDCTIDVECPARIPDPRDGASPPVLCEAEVELLRSAGGLYTVPIGCPCGDHGRYTVAQVLALKDAAESHHDNYDPTPYEVDCGGESAGERREQSAREQRTLK